MTVDAPDLTAARPLEKTAPRAPRLGTRSRTRLLLRRLTRGTTPLHVVAATAVAGATWNAVGPIDDYDFFWHAELGGEILSLSLIHI